MANSVLAKMAVQISANTAEFNKRMAESAKALDNVGKQTSKTNSILTSFGALIGTAGLALGVGALAKSIFDLGVKAEQTTIAFNTFLGSASRGRDVLQKLNQFSIETPFTPDQVNNAAKALLSFGLEANKLIPTLKFLGDVSSGTGKDLTEMAIIFGQIRSTGRLMGQDLLQLINAGFNPLQVISEKTGKSVGQLKKEMEKGLISFEMVEDAFKTATAEGGLFFDLMNKQSQTVGGKISTLSGNFQDLGKNIFALASGPIPSLVDAFNSAVVAVNKFLKAGDVYDIAEISLKRFRDRLTEVDGYLQSTDKKLQEYGKTLQNEFAKDVVSAINEVTQEIADSELFLQGFAKGDRTSDLYKQTADEIRVLKAELEGLQNIKTDLFKARVKETFDNVNKSIEGTKQKIKDLKLEFIIPADAGFLDSAGDVANVAAANEQKEALQSLATEGYDLLTASMQGAKLETVSFGEATQNTAKNIERTFIQLSPLIADFATNLAEGLGQAIAGTSSFGKSFLKAIANFMGQLGRQMIALGIAKLNLDKLISVPGAGAALVAAGLALTVAASAVSGTIAGGYSNRGVSRGVSAPVNNFSRSTTVLLDGQFKIEGRDLVYVVNKNTNLDKSRKG